MKQTVLSCLKVAARDIFWDVHGNECRWLEPSLCLPVDNVNSCFPDE